VKGGVGLEEPGHLALPGVLLHRGDQALEPVEVRCVESRDGQPHGHHLERLTHLVGLEELLLGERADDGTAPRPDRDEPFRRQPADGLPDRAPADSEVRRERHLLQLRAGLQTA